MRLPVPLVTLPDHDGGDTPPERVQVGTVEVVTFGEHDVQAAGSILPTRLDTARAAFRFGAYGQLELDDFDFDVADDGLMTVTRGRISAVFRGKNPAWRLSPAILYLSV